MKKNQSVKPKIPTDAIKVFKGAIFDVFQWQQQMFDGTFQTFEKLKRPDTVLIIAITKDQKIIITEEEQPSKEPFISLPGGRVEEGEEVKTAAARELLEETGFKSKTMTLLDQTQPVSKIDWTIYTYVAKDCAKITEPHLDAGEKIKVNLVTFDQFVKLVITDKFNEYQLKFKIMEALIDPKKMSRIKKLFFD